MANYDYYQDINPNEECNKDKNPKRTILFFLDAIKKGREHILNLYNPKRITDKRLHNESFKIIKKYGMKDRNLEIALAKILTNLVGYPEEDKNHLRTVYLSDLLERFVLNPEKENSIREKTFEYASFRSSADYILVFYGSKSKPELELARAEAECLVKEFADGKRCMSLNDILNNGRSFYEHASATAVQILEEDFFRLSDTEKQKWDTAVRINEKIAKEYDICLEILRTVNYKLFAVNN